MSLETDRTQHRPPTRETAPGKCTNPRTHTVPRRRVASWLLGALALATAPSVPASHPNDIPEEPYDAGWTLYADNDRLSLTESDEDYTAGFSMVLSGQRARDYWLSLDGALGRVNRWLGLQRFSDGDPAQRYHSFGYGMAAFTPKAISDSEPRHDQRPYACLAFMHNTRQTLIPARNTNYVTTLVLGLLGTNLCENVQDLIHDWTDGVEARGWSHQIAEGGEPTLLWRGSRQRLLHEDLTEDSHHQITWSVDAQLGYVVDVGAGISWRWGNLRTPWWSFAPQHSEYAPLGMPQVPLQRIRTNQPVESYIWAGGMVRYRLFNALLQGQFRDSEVEIDSDCMEPLLLEVWFGIAQEFASGYQLSLSIRARSDEFDGPGGKSIAWGSLALRRLF